MPEQDQSFSFQIDEFYLDLQADGSKISLLSEEDFALRPFPGLRPFRTSEFQLFKGRDGQAEELIKRLKRKHFLAVIGSSGTGKSSLIRAGLIPQLFGGYLHDAGGKWNIAICRPGKDPIENLAISLSGVKNRSKDKEKLIEGFKIIEPILRRSIYGILEINDLLNENVDEKEHSNLLIIIDQFEEVFRFDRSDLEQINIENHFVNLLLKASANPESGIYVIITMRSEFLGDCVRYRDLPEAINEGQYLVPQLGRTQLKEVIEGPICLAKKKISPGLVELLINEIEESKLKNNLDQLPILQHALMRTYNEAMSFGQETEIDFSHYESIGGMSKALANHAEVKHNELGVELSNGPSKKQQIVRIIFQALTDQSTELKGGRRPTELKNLYAITKSIDATSEETNEVVDHFRDPYTSFIMPPNNTILYGGLMIDISHESLMRNWERLSEWIKEESLDGQLYSKLNERRELYEKEHDKTGLIRGILLRELIKWEEEKRHNSDWAKRYTKDTGAYESIFVKNIEFLHLSRTEYENSSAIEKSEIEKKLKEQQRVKNAKMISWISGIAATVSFIFLYLALNQRSKAMEQRNIANKTSYESNIKDSSWYKNKLVKGYKKYIANTLFDLYSKQTKSDSLEAEKIIGSLNILDEAYKNLNEDWGLYIHLLGEAKSSNNNFITSSILDSVLALTIPFKRRMKINTSGIWNKEENQTILKFLFGDRNNSFVMGNSNGFFKYNILDSTYNMLIPLKYNSNAAAISNDTKKLISYNIYSGTFNLYEQSANGTYKSNNTISRINKACHLNKQQLPTRDRYYRCSAAFSSDNNQLVIYKVQSDNDTIQILLYNLGKQKVKAIILNAPYLFNVSFSHDNHKLLICLSDSILVINPENPDFDRKTILVPSSNSKNSKFGKALYYLGDTIIGVYDNKIYKWDSSRQLTDSIVVEGKIKNIFLSRDFKIQLYTTTRDDDPDKQYINFLANKTGRSKLFPWHNSEITDIDISGNDYSIISSDNYEIYNWGNKFSNLSEKAIDSFVDHESLQSLYQERGDSCYKNRNYDGAVNNYLKTLPYRTKGGLIFNQIGNSYFGLKRYSQANEFYKKAIETDSSIKVYQSNLAESYIRLKEYLKAISIMNKVQTSDSSYGNDIIGDAYAWLDNYKMALKYYKRAIVVDTLDASTLSSLGLCYYYSNMKDSSIAILIKSLKINDKLATAWNTLALNYIQKKNYYLARIYLKKALSLVPNDDTYLSNLAAYYLVLGNYPLAIEYANSSNISNPNNSRAYAARGFSYLRLKKFDLALREISKSILLDSNDYKNYLCLSAYYSTQNQPEAALNNFRRAFQNASLRQLVDLLWFEGNDSFDNINKDPEFIKLMNLLEERSGQRK